MSEGIHSYLGCGCLRNADRTPLKGSRVVATSSAENRIPLLQLDWSETKLFGDCLARFLRFDLLKFSNYHDDGSSVLTVWSLQGSLIQSSAPTANESQWKSIPLR
jgi:hypothetical protein